MKYTCHLSGFIGLSYKWVENILLQESLDLLGMNMLSARLLDNLWVILARGIKLF